MNLWQWHGNEFLTLALFQVREESGEGEAPTLRDPSTGDILVPPQDEQQQAGATPTTPKAQESGLEVDEERVIVVTPKSPGIEPDDIYVKPIVKLDSKIEDLTTGNDCWNKSSALNRIPSQSLYLIRLEIGLF